MLGGGLYTDFVGFAALCTGIGRGESSWWSLLLRLCLCRRARWWRVCLFMWAIVAVVYVFELSRVVSRDCCLELAGVI